MQVLSRRGPDSTRTHSIRLNPSPVLAASFDSSSSGSLESAHQLSFIGSVLHLRGAFGVTAQPLLCSQTGNVLLWNGEVFGGLTLNDEDNDTRAVFDLLNGADQDNLNDEDHDSEAIVKVMERIEGPWAFIFWQV